MENTKVSAKKNAGGIILDILTIGMLFASFAALFYSGFILQTDTFPLGALCAITAVGLLLLFFIGNVSCLSSKVRNKTLSPGFLVFSAVQLIALIVNLALLLGIMVKMFSVDGLFARLTYGISVFIVLVGYVASISYFSDGKTGDLSDEEDSEEEEDAEEEESAAEEDSAEEPEDVEEIGAEEAAEADEEADSAEEPEEAEETGAEAREAKNEEEETGEDKTNEE